MLQSKTNWKRILFIIGALIPPLLVSLGMVIYPIIQTIIQMEAQQIADPADAAENAVLLSVQGAEILL